MSIDTRPITNSADAVFNAWRDYVATQSRLPHVGAALQADVRRLCELLDAFESGTSASIAQDAYQTAYALAMKALEDFSQRNVIAVFRDAFGMAAEQVSDHSDATLARLRRFLEIIGDAYWQAYSDDLKKTIRKQAADNIAKELRLAKHIQQYLLPKAIPQIEGYEFAGRLIPAAEVGGDYWSVKYYEEDGIVTFKLADIAGHGLASAMLVAAVKFISGGNYQGAKTAAAVMQKTNHVLVKETPSDILVTMCYGWLHPESGDVNIVNAGHSPILIFHGDEVLDIAPTGPVLGLAESRYGERRLHLEPGDIVFTCSDGITEARRGKEIFGVERVKDLVLTNRHLDASGIIDKVVNAAQEYAGGVTDDMSVVVIRVLEGGSQGRYRDAATGTGFESKGRN
jgi:serine phosphatase RsbU (regulator of sigma subunit)